MNELFDRTYEELCREFVRGRLGEFQVFGREDMQEWLEGQAKAEHPDLEGWIEALESGPVCKAFDLAVAGELLMKSGYCLTPDRLEKVRTSFTEEIPLLKLTPFIESLVDSRTATVFLGLSDYPVVVTHDEHRNVTGIFDLVDPCSDIARSDVASSQVLGSLCRVWERDPQSGKVVRAELCRRLSVIVGEVVSEAWEDFDKAVACSADGRQIVHADEAWVFRWGCLERTVLRKVPTTATKVLLEPEVYCGAWERGDSPEEQWDHILINRREEGVDILPDPTRQQLLYNHNHSDRRILWTDESYVPRELLSSP